MSNCTKRTFVREDTRERERSYRLRSAVHTMAFRVQTVVIGAGVVGLAAARALAVSGHEVPPLATDSIVISNAHGHGQLMQPMSHR